MLYKNKIKKRKMFTKQNQILGRLTIKILKHGQYIKTLKIHRNIVRKSTLVRQQIMSISELISIKCIN